MPPSYVMKNIALLKITVAATVAATAYRCGGSSGSDATATAIAIATPDESTRTTAATDPGTAERPG